MSPRHHANVELQVSLIVDLVVLRLLEHTNHLCLSAFEWCQPFQIISDPIEDRGKVTRDGKEKGKNDDKRHLNYW